MNTITLDIAGGQLTISKDALFLAWIEKTLGHPKSSIAQPKIGQLWTAQGGIYAGTVAGENGAPDYHLITSDKEYEISKCKWSVAVESAKTVINGFNDWSLMDRREARIAATNAPESFAKDAYYWTATQLESDPDYACIQFFDNGGQGWYRKSTEYLARAVRRVLIIQ